MKKFKFRYQTLLEVRERRQKAEEETLHRLAAEEHEAEQELLRLQQEEAAARAAMLQAQQNATLDLDELMLFQSHLLGLERRMRAQERAIEEARERVLMQRQVFLDAKRDAEIVAKLKERDRKDWQKALDQAEALLIDELAMGKHVRKKK